jgi:hypothetical protein
MQQGETDSEERHLMDKARATGHAFKIFVQENERMRQYLTAIESMVREMEAMKVSARSQQTDMHDFFACARLKIHRLQVPGRI